MIFLFVTYLIPIVFMCLGYGKMGKVLWGSEQIGEVTDRQMVSLKSKRRVST